MNLDKPLFSYAPGKTGRSYLVSIKPGLIRRLRQAMTGLLSAVMTGLAVFSALAPITSTSVEAHNLDTSVVYMYFDPDSQAALKTRALAGDPLIQVNDEIGLIIKVVPDNGTQFGVGGYVDFYVPNGVQVVNAEYVYPTGTGYQPFPMKGQSRIAIGDGTQGGSDTPELRGLLLGPNILGNSDFPVDDPQITPISGTGLDRGTIAGVYGDTGIFYSYDVETAFETYVSSGGFDGNTGTVDNEISNNSGDTIVPLNKWDAEQLLAYGVSGSPIANPYVDDDDGRGNAPWGLANVVAGPQSGYAWGFDRDIYDADNDGVADGDMIAAVSSMGPWNRLQYPGSLAAEDVPGLQSDVLGTVGVDASSFGYSFAGSGPLPMTVSQSDGVSPNVVRFSIGQLEINVPEFIRVTVKVNDVNALDNNDGTDDSCATFNGATFGGDAGDINIGKDHLWRYYQPSRVFLNSCLAIGKTADQLAVLVGESFEYTIAFYNAGEEDDLTNVVIEDTLPADVSYTPGSEAAFLQSGGSAPVSIPLFSGPNPLAWHVGTMVPGDYFVATFDVVADATGIQRNVVDGYTDQGNAQAVELTPVGAIPILLQNKSVSSLFVMPGGQVEYTLTIDNIGTGETGNPIVITDHLPAGFSYASSPAFSVTIGSVAVSGGTVDVANPNEPVFTIPAAIPRSGQLSLTFTADVDGSVAYGNYCNSYTSAQQPPGTNKERTLVTGALACVDVAPALSLGDTTFDDLDYDGQFNIGEELAGVLVELFESDSVTPATDFSGSVVASITTLADGKYQFSNLPEDNYVVQLTPPAGYFQTLPQESDPNTDIDNDSNIAIESMTGIFQSGVISLVRNAEPDVAVDGDDTNANQTIDFGFTTGADLEIIKTASSDRVFSGQSLTYTLTVTNNGPANATSVVVADSLPSGVVHVSTTPSQGSCSNPGGVTCELGNIPKLGFATIDIVVTVN